MRKTDIVTIREEGLIVVSVTIQQSEGFCKASCLLSDNLLSLQEFLVRGMAEAEYEVEAEVRGHEPYDRLMDGENLRRLSERCNE